MTQHELFDPGLQPERTELAWQRTALAFAIASLISLRMLPDVLGSAAWIALGAFGVAVAGVVWWSGWRRYGAVTRALLSPAGASALPDGRLILAAAIFAIAIGALGTLVVVWIALGLAP